MIHTEQVYRKVAVSKPLGVQASSQPGYHDGFGPTVVDSEKVVYVAIERRGPIDEVPVVLHGRNEREMDYGYSAAEACKHLAACSYWDGYHDRQCFEVYNYHRWAAS